MMLESFITFANWPAVRSLQTLFPGRPNACDRIGTVQLLPQRGFHSLFCVCGQGGIRDVADFFRKLTRDLANVFQLLHVPLAERAHEVMDPQLYPHHQREFFIHPER
jgi:hypothetical protein